MNDLGLLVAAIAALRVRNGLHGSHGEARGDIENPRGPRPPEHRAGRRPRWPFGARTA
jgi:hypothetical protein